mmetsp:Transcript_10071/g.25223  ORF Transcript_10071/g.25223 Transcript_10071/m.25223 type:complete len:394 (-) Transcript_10071:204-1385(-)|eukprot:CAMPEP_0115264768 /NCGR_PEP_ID=MMETSP0270-20121206/50603_1 /TAXON_ID=71861 /ORGANISM="Scrippsiella trochoidea, Strain CCMP3099" /LENGTH=393 /DNA_ID=CAMNT_0002680805 /DNA_START=22 /DNA_END=1203 /DNA_ORIENTATION=+
MVAMKALIIAAASVASRGRRPDWIQDGWLLEEVMYKCETVPTWDAHGAETCRGNPGQGACFSLSKGVYWACSSNPHNCVRDKFDGACLISGHPGYQQAADYNGVPPAPSPTPPVPSPAPPSPPAPDAVIGWNPSGPVVGGGKWCQVNSVGSSFDLRQHCAQHHGGASFRVKVLTYNLFWWNLFGQRHGNGGSAGHNIRDSVRGEAYDLMGFQECENLDWVLGDAGLAGQYGRVLGQHATCLAYRSATWDLIASARADVAEDQPSQYYGRREAEWVRLRHKGTGKTMFFVNHHGPLPVNSGGVCGGQGTAFNLLKLIGENAHKSDTIILVGDFNSDGNSETVKTLSNFLAHSYIGTKFNGVDNFFTNCAQAIERSNLGGAGSDHDALSVVFQVS